MALDFQEWYEQHIQLCTTVTRTSEENMAMAFAAGVYRGTHIEQNRPTLAKDSQWEMYQKLCWIPDLNSRLRSLAESLGKSDLSLCYEAMQRIDAQREHINFLERKLAKAETAMKLCTYCGQKHFPEDEAYKVLEVCSSEPISESDEQLRLGELSAAMKEDDIGRCGHCCGTGRMIRDQDIGTDQECFVCEGSGRVTWF